MAQLSPETKIWRYMDVYKLFDLLKNERLFIPAAPILENDPLEGLSQSSHQVWKLVRASRQKRIQGASNEAELAVEIQKKLFTDERFVRHFIGVSCWHKNDGECFGMWQSYTLPKGGVAIMSNIRSVSEFIRKGTTYAEVSEGEVEYSDDKPQQQGPLNTKRFFFKRKVFENEKEYRFLVNYLPRTEAEAEEENSTRDSMVEDKGVYVKVNLEQLVDKIIISPGLESWEREGLKDVITKFLPNIDVADSVLLEK